MRSVSRYAASYSRSASAYRPEPSAAFAPAIRSCVFAFRFSPNQYGCGISVTISGPAFRAWSAIRVASSSTRPPSSTTASVFRRSDEPFSVVSGTPTGASARKWMSSRVPSSFFSTSPAGKIGRENDRMSASTATSAGICAVM